MLEVRNLNISFYNGKEQIRCADRVCFDVGAGEIVALVGESGCGKSITALSILRLLGRNACVSGEVLYKGKNLLELSEKEMDKIRGNHISMVFQDITYSLNPVFTVGNQMVEAMIHHLDVGRKSARCWAKTMLELAGIEDTEAVMRKYPHMLSGGQRQRVMIAMALMCKPDLVIADEPTTALDVTIQRQIMELLVWMKKEMGLSVLLITHDIALVAEVADRVVVMYAGQCVEEGSVEDVLNEPLHPYTEALLRAIPGIRSDRNTRLYSIPGTVPENYHQMTGCRFAPRCEYAEGCRMAGEMYGANGRYVRCDQAQVVKKEREGCGA